MNALEDLSASESSSDTNTESDGDDEDSSTSETSDSDTNSSSDSRMLSPSEKPIDSKRQKTSNEDVEFEIESFPEEVTLETFSENEYESEDELTRDPGFAAAGCSSTFHNIAVVESKTLSGLPLTVEVSYQLAFNREGIQLTQMQYETIRLICNRHEVILPNEKRAGFLLGDGPGVGKTRVAAGVYKENCMRGRQKCLWVTCTFDLVPDICANLRKLGSNCTVVYPSDFRNCNAAELVICCTYKTLISKSGDRKQTFGTNVCEYLQGDSFDGLIVLDECHKAKNLIPIAAERSMTSVAVMKLQSSFPNARILYCSATAMTEVQHIGYLERLGLWGIGTPFKKTRHLIRTLENSGLIGLELLSIDLKRKGCFLSRSISFTGVNCFICKVPATNEFNKLYNASIAVWNLLIEALRKVECREISSKFWSAQQRYFATIITSSKIDGTVKCAEKALNEGKAVVIGLQSTGEAVFRRHLKDERLGVASNASDYLVGVFDLLGLHFDTKTSTLSTTSKRFPDTFPKLVEAMKVLYPLLPVNPLDELKSRLGGERVVAELTGRAYGASEFSDGSFSSRRLCSTSQLKNTTNRKEMEFFQRGIKKIAIISEAASTGVSLHSEKLLGEPESGKKRVHITLEMPWSAEKVLQQLGRTNRSNQQEPPVYVLMVSPIPAEVRFTSTIVMRLRSMGALCQADRDCSSVYISSELGTDHKKCTKATKLVIKDAIFRRNAFRNAFFKAGLISYDKKEKLVSKSRTLEMFLNRLLCLKIDEQQRVLLALAQKVETICGSVGFVDNGILELKRNQRALPVSLVESQSFVFGYTTALTLNTIEVDRGMQWSDICQLVACCPESKFMCNESGRLILATGSGTQQKIYFPSIGFIGSDNSIKFDLSKYAVADSAYVEKAWKEELTNFSFLSCVHLTRSSQCKRPSCQHNTRMKRFHIITGELINVLSRMTKLFGRMQVARFEMPDEALIGLLLPLQHLANFKQKYGLN